MSVNAISKSSYPHMTRMLQVEDPDNQHSISVTHQRFKNQNGKDITREDYHVRNPNGSDMSKLLEHLQDTSDKNTEQDMFKAAMKHINNLESGVVKPMPSEVSKITSESITPPSEKKSDNSQSIKEPRKQGMTISNNELKNAVYGMREDFKKDY
jgi:hypothetical protein